jgi:glycerate 2-kinase
VSYFRNKGDLLSQGRSGLRRLVLDIADVALTETDPYPAALRQLSLDGDTLVAGVRRYALSAGQRIFAIGAGKATFPIAKAIEEVLGPHLHSGLVVCKHGQEGSLARIELRLASHPMPDKASFEAAMATQELLREVRAGDIVIACFSGGSSSLFVDPVPGVSLEDKACASQVLLTCGANIIEINNVRKHLSLVKGGRLVRRLPAGTHVINLTVSDVIGDALDYITDPSVPDRSTSLDARATLEKYGLKERLPASVVNHLMRGDADAETAREADLAHLDRHDILLVSADAACHAAARAALARGLTPVILSTRFEGESLELGRTMAAIAKQILLDGNPAKPPCLLIGGGETTVHLLKGHRAGSGGPNQEFAASVALEIESNPHIVALGLDTDGTDGPTPYAGAIVDGSSATTARRQGIDLHRKLADHDVSAALEQIGDIVITGATGNNVNDLKLVVVADPNQNRT